MRRDAGQNNAAQREIARPVGRSLLAAYSVQNTNIGSIRNVRCRRTSTPNSRPTGMDQLRIRYSLLLFYMHGYSGCGTEGIRAMRVIAGKYRSRPLRSLRGMDIRPTSDRLRETLFNVLTAGNPAALEGSVWLDLFAGTGAVGIEAFSRGAKEVHFVESSAAAAEMIRKNLHSLGIAGGFKVLKDELPRAFWRMERQRVAADVVFIDPPYRMQDAYAKTLRALAEFVFDLGNVGGDCGT